MRNPDSIKRDVAAWLRQGVTPFRLALTLALGFAIGCIPVIGIPTVLCAGLAIGFGLNLPAIQAANYAAMPLQLLLLVPFVRMGRWIFSWTPVQAPMHAWTAGTLLQQSSLHQAPLHFASQMGWLAAEAVLAWVLVAVPAVTVMTATLTPMLKRIPACASAQETESAAA